MGGSSVWGGVREMRVRGGQQAPGDGAEGPEREGGEASMRDEDERGGVQGAGGIDIGFV